MWFHFQQNKVYAKHSIACFLWIFQRSLFSLFLYLLLWITTVPFFIYYSKIYLKCVFWLVYPFSLRFIAYGPLDKQNLLDSDSAGSARWLFTNRFASIILKTKNNNKNRKYHFEPFKFRFYNTEGKMLLKLSRNFVKQSVKHSSKGQANQWTNYLIFS